MIRASHNSVIIEDSNCDGIFDIYSGDQVYDQSGQPITVSQALEFDESLSQKYGFYDQNGQSLSARLQLQDYVMGYVAGPPPVQNQNLTGLKGRKGPIALIAAGVVVGVGWFLGGESDNVTVTPGITVIPLPNFDENESFEIFSSKMSDKDDEHDKKIEYLPPAEGDPWDREGEVADPFQENIPEPFIHSEAGDKEEVQVKEVDGPVDKVLQDEDELALSAFLNWCSRARDIEIRMAKGEDFDPELLKGLYRKILFVLENTPNEDVFIQVLLGRAMLALQQGDWDDALFALGKFIDFYTYDHQFDDAHIRLGIEAISFFLFRGFDVPIWLRFSLTTVFQNHLNLQTLDDDFCEVLEFDENNLTVDDAALILGLAFALWQRSQTKPTKDANRLLLLTRPLLEESRRIYHEAGDDQNISRIDGILKAF